MLENPVRCRRGCRFDVHPLSGRFRGQVGCGRLRSESFAMHDENDPEIEYSPLCEEVMREGLNGPCPDLPAQNRQ